MKQVNTDIGNTNVSDGNTFILSSSNIFRTQSLLDLRLTDIIIDVIRLLAVTKEGRTLFLEEATQRIISKPGINGSFVG